MLLLSMYIPTFPSCSSPDIKSSGAKETTINDKPSASANYCSRRWNGVVRLFFFFFLRYHPNQYKLSVIAIFLQKSFFLTVIKVGCSVGGLPKTETSKDSGLMEFQKAWRCVWNVTVCVWILKRGKIRRYLAHPPQKGIGKWLRIPSGK